MDRDTAVTLLKKRLRRQNDSSIASDIITELQATQDRLEGGITLPWFLVEDDTSAQCTVDSENVALQTGYLRAYEEGGALWYRENTTDKWLPIDRDDYAPAYNKNGITTGAPDVYSLEGLYYKLSPIPDKAYYIRRKSYVKDAVLDTNIENNWLKYASDLLLAETGIVIATFYIRNMELANEMKGWAQAAHATFFAASEAHKHADRGYKMGDD